MDKTIICPVGDRPELLFPALREFKVKHVHLLTLDEYTDNADYYKEFEKIYTPTDTPKSFSGIMMPFLDKNNPELGFDYEHLKKFINIYGDIIISIIANKPTYPILITPIEQNETHKPIAKVASKSKINTLKKPVVIPEKQMTAPETTIDEKTSLNLMDADIEIIDYSEASYAIIGETWKLASLLRTIGVFSKHININGKKKWGWFVSKKKIAELV